ncbi:uncharacterized protein LOC143299452 [Babylonia areolata]|uniref:uncharacterized protein LOC143299452 n=1 Tax=Babylonia areolata TaxID=304850 RepID=UPI003FD57FD8
MPSVPQSITSLSDKQLLEELRSYNFDAGPILATTRAVYQRKLFSLQTGRQVETPTSYPPAPQDDDDHDEPVVYRSPPQPRPRATFTQTQRDQRSPERSPLRQPSPRKPLHPGMGDTPRYQSRAGARVPASRRVPQPRTGGGSLMSWLPVSIPVLVVGVAAIGVFLYLVFRNMESDPVSSIPDEIEMNV